MVDLAEGAYTFVLDTIHAIGKALSWIWDKIKVGLKKLIKFLGWFFGWGDIIDTQQSMLNFATAALTYTSGKIGDAQSKVDEMSQFLKQQLQNLSSPINEGEISDTPINKEQNSIGYNWMSYQLVHGGAMQKFQVGPSSKSAPIASSGTHIAALPLLIVLIQRTKTLKVSAISSSTLAHNWRTISTNLAKMSSMCSVAWEKVFPYRIFSQSSQETWP